jgi:hypothetical protein
LKADLFVKGEKVHIFLMHAYLEQSFQGILNFRLDASHEHDENGDDDGEDGNEEVSIFVSIKSI